MGVRIWINKGKIFLSICHNGRRWRESTGLTVTEIEVQQKEVMRLAELLRSKKEVALIAEKNGLLDQIEKQPNVSGE